MKRVLAVCAHPDDEVLGVGGTLAREVLEGKEVFCLILGEGLTARSENRDNVNDKSLEVLRKSSRKAAEIIGFKEVFFSNFPDNRFDSLDLLDIIKDVEKYVEKIEPEIIYTHHYADLNIDHRRVFEAVITACRPTGKYKVREIYTFATPSSTEWNFKKKDEFQPNYFVDIKNTINYKIKAMKCYKSELKDFPHPRSIRALKAIAVRWGTVVGCEYVEPFELIRKVKR